jgi:hypothetical protein
MTEQNKPEQNKAKPQSGARADAMANVHGDEQVHDQGTTDVSASEVANAAAESLHGARAEKEKYAQPDAKALVGGSTLISDPKGANPAAGERV